MDFKTRVAKLFYNNSANKTSFSNEELKELKEKLSELGLILIESDTKVSVAVDSSLIGEGTNVLSEKIQGSSLETLIIIAYCGPISKEDIDALRFVNSSASLKKLLGLSLVDKEQKCGQEIYKINEKGLALLAAPEQNELERKDEFCKTAREYLKQLYEEN